MTKHLVLTQYSPQILMNHSLVMSSQVGPQGQPMAGQVVGANPVLEANYRRSVLTNTNVWKIQIHQQHFCRYQYYTRLQNQTGVNLEVLVSVKF